LKSTTVPNWAFFFCFSSLLVPLLLILLLLFLFFSYLYFFSLHPHPTTTISLCTHYLRCCTAAAPPSSFSSDRRNLVPLLLTQHSQAHSFGHAFTVSAITTPNNIELAQFKFLLIQHFGLIQIQLN
jgi:hypothetical protein